MSVETHQMRGTYREDRHGTAQKPTEDSYSASDRRRLLRGLPAPARRLAVSLLATYRGFDSTSLETLRAYVLSCDRLATLQTEPSADVRSLHKEIRANLALLKALELDR
jgi:hypothetical protein